MDRLKMVGSEEPPKDKAWFAKGLRFKCTECGGCCTGGPGYVWIDPEEIEAMAEHLGISIDTFTRSYVRKVGDRYSLTETPQYDCVFLKGKKCSLYAARPRQCRTFPWWSYNLESQEAWDEAGKYCEGIDHPDAPLISYKEICARRDSQL
jgi:hypothetical protein